MANNAKSNRNMHGKKNAKHGKEAFGYNPDRFLMAFGDIPRHFPNHK